MTRISKLVSKLIYVMTGFELHDTTIARENNACDGGVGRTFEADAWRESAARNSTTDKKRSSRRKADKQ